MGRHAAVTTRAKTSRSTCAAPPRSSARAAALAVAPEVRTSSTRTILRPFRRPCASAEARNAPWTFSVRCARLRPTWLLRRLDARSAGRARKACRCLPRDRMRERRGLVEAPRPQPQRMQRHGRERVGARRECRRRRAPSSAPIGLASSARSEYFSRCTRLARRPVLETRHRAGARERRADRRSPAATAGPARGPARTACRAGRRTAAR